MNAVEIEAAISELALHPFDPDEFPYAFLAAFGNKETALRRLRANNGQSDVAGGIVQRNFIHMAVCEAGGVGRTLAALRESAATAKGKCKFVLATDGRTLEAEELSGGETISCAYLEFPNHFGFFLPLAGITSVKEIKDNPVDIRATGRLNKLYVELLREDPEWGSDQRRADMNHFMARLVFCFFAEDTEIFPGEGLFTRTVEQMSDRDGSNTHLVIEAIFRAMNIKREEREQAIPRLPHWVSDFPYVNGGLFDGATSVPRFTHMARSYLLHTGSLNWKKINPDIFGSMIQAVADESERGALGMHYTSVPNILKVLNPLFLDDLRAALTEAGDNERKLLNLRKRMARIRVFDPACGSGNFLVIAYKQMREIEAQINQRRGETHFASEIPLTNFRGIELRDFPAEIARLALIIAEFQCDVLYSGQKDALAKFLPLDAQNWIVCGNALRLDWLSICPPTGTGVKVISDDLFETPLNQTEIDFENEGGETYICGNPPYLGSRSQDELQKDELNRIFSPYTKGWKSLDYVSGWFALAAKYGTETKSSAAFVATNSICQGIQAPILWPLISSFGSEIVFAHTSFKWQNLASKNAGVTVVVVGLGTGKPASRRLFSISDDGSVSLKETSNINAYLVPAANILIEKRSAPIGPQAEMTFGNTPIDGGNLLLSRDELSELGLSPEQTQQLVRPIYGSREFIKGLQRYCLWIDDAHLAVAEAISPVKSRIERVRALRLEGGTTAREISDRPHQFQRMISARENTIIVPIHTSESREYLPVGLLPPDSIVTNAVCALYDAPLWNMALIASRLHLVWIATVCGKLETRYRYSNTLGWNTFPVSLLTEQNKVDLTRCAQEILLAREAHFPDSIAELYDPEDMPDDLRRAHLNNDEVVERIYIGRRFRNDTERLEKLFELYTKSAAGLAKAIAATKSKKGRRLS